MSSSEIKPSQQRPPAGLPLEAWAELGLVSAQKKVAEEVAPPAGLPLAKWAELGLESAKQKLEALSSES